MGNGALAYWGCFISLPPNKRNEEVKWIFFNDEWNVRQEKNREKITSPRINIPGMAKGSSSPNTPQK